MVVCGVWWGNSATHASLLYLRCSKKKKKKKARGCSRLPLGVVLTFLQLSHQVIVLEESVTAERVREQHLEKGTTLIHRNLRTRLRLENTEMKIEYDAGGTKCQNVIKCEARQLQTLVASTGRHNWRKIWVIHDICAFLHIVAISQNEQNQTLTQTSFSQTG